MKKHLKSLSLTLLKLGFAFGALAYVLYKTDINEIKVLILNSDPLLLFSAFICLHISTLLAAHRLKVYFSEEHMKLPEKYAIPAFYMNTFFNTVLPGGIGGDGYLAILFRKHFKFPVLRSIRLILTSRANGLFFLNIFFFVAMWFSDFAVKFPVLKTAIITLFILQVPVYMLASRYLLKETFSSFYKAGIFSLASQIFFILGAYCAFMAIGIDDLFNYLSLYIGSSIAAIIPITPGGVGLRELIFYKGSLLIDLDSHMAVAGSLTYYAVYFTMSLTGLVFYLIDNKMHKRREI